MSRVQPAIRTISAAEVPIIRPLISAYAYKPYRNYRVLSRRAQDATLEAEVTAVLASGDGFVFHATDAHGSAALVLRRLPWDSEFFGVRMARIEYLLRSDDDPRLAAEVVSACADACRAERIQHVAARVDVGDTIAISVLEDRGYRLMDALVTYTYHPRREPPPPVREMGVLREYRASDADAIVEVARESYRGFRGRFHLDPHIPDERCDELYVEWARQCVRGRMADQLFVTEDGQGRLMGFLAFRLRQPVSQVGSVNIYGGGLGACRREAPGAYAGLIRAGTVWAHARGALAECQTQNYNFPTVRVYEAVGSRYVRADYTFHTWYG